MFPGEWHDWHPSGRPQYERRPYQQPYGGPPKREATPFNVLSTSELQIERKFYDFSLRENHRGRFVQVKEGGFGKTNVIVIPDSGLENFIKSLQALLAASKQTPPAPPPAE